MPDDVRSHYDAYWSSPRAPAAPASGQAEDLIRLHGYGRMLDVGCGDGGLVKALVARGADAHGVDLSERAIARGRPRLTGRLYVADAAALPFPDSSFDLVVSHFCLDHCDETQLTSALAEIHRVCRRDVHIRVALKKAADTDIHPRLDYGYAAWERRLLAAGFRKHPDHYEINPFGASRPADAVFFLTRSTDDHPAGFLGETGSDADARGFLAHRACYFVRPGDSVVVGGDRPLDTAYLVARGTRAHSVDAVAADVAPHGYAAAGLPLAVHAGEPPAARDVSIHCGPAAAAPPPAFGRLRPAGRLLYLLSDVESAPHWLTLQPKADSAAVLESRLLLRTTEDGQTEILDLTDKADGAVLRPDSRYYLFLALSRAPFGGREDYRAHCLAAGSAQTARFGDDYDNPWLLSALVTIGLRVEAPGIRRAWIDLILEQEKDDSADVGAALCNRLYMDLDADAPNDAILRRATAYLDLPVPRNTTVLRWQISIAYVLGLLFRNRGDFDRSAALLDYVLARRAETYSPLLLTKTVSAAVLLATSRLSAGRDEDALTLLRATYFRVRQAVGAALSEASDTLPEYYEMPELAQVLQALGGIAALARDMTLRSQRARLAYDRRTAPGERALAQLTLDNARLANDLRSLAEYLAEVEKARDFFFGLHAHAERRITALEATLSGAGET